MTMPTDPERADSAFYTPAQWRDLLPLIARIDALERGQASMQAQVADHARQIELWACWGATEPPAVDGPLEIVVTRRETTGTPFTPTLAVNAPVDLGDLLGRRGESEGGAVE